MNVGYMREAIQSCRTTTASTSCPSINYSSSSIQKSSIAGNPLSPKKGFVFVFSLSPLPFSHALPPLAFPSQPFSQQNSPAIPSLPAALALHSRKFPKPSDSELWSTPKRHNANETMVAIWGFGRASRNGR